MAERREHGRQTDGKDPKKTSPAANPVAETAL